MIGVQSFATFLIIVFSVAGTAPGYNQNAATGVYKAIGGRNEHNRYTASPSTTARDWVVREHQQHVAEAIDTLLNVEKIPFDHDEAGHLVPVDRLLPVAGSIVTGSLLNQKLPVADDSTDSISLQTTTATIDNRNENFDSAFVGGESLDTAATMLATSEASAAESFDQTSANIVSGSEASLSIINQTFSDIFLRVRSDDHSPQLKEVARNKIIERLRDLKIEVFTQSFTTMKRGANLKGMNIIGILPGRHQNVPGKDRILLVGAHYDTVSTSPGVDDNASGMIVVMELARILSNQPLLNHTVMFVGFDLEELGLLGSVAFVREYLIPKELLAKKAHFLGAYVIDMALNHDTTPGAQTLPRDLTIACPGVTAKISMEGNRGDFIAVWSRQGVDSEVHKSLVNEWKGSTKFKLRTFDPLLPADTPSSTDLYRFGTFTRSDHASFWYHKHPEYKETLNAVLLTDMGPWRGSVGSKCYHNWCDDSSQLTERNFKFLKNTIDSLAAVFISNPPAAKSDSNSDAVTPWPFVTTSPTGRGSRNNRGRVPTNRFRPHWPSFPSSFPSQFPPSFRSPGFSFVSHV